MSTSSADVADLRARNDRAARLAQNALLAFWGRLDLSDPYKARDALLAFMPILVKRYGETAATLAADWYEGMRAREVGGRFTALVADAAPAEQVQKNVRFFAGHLFDGTPQVMLSAMAGVAQKHVVDASRATIRDNTFRDPAKPRYARIPTGKCCAWCSLLASRGFVYRTADTAGEHAHFHAHDRCTVASSWDDSPAIEGYNPGRLYSLYQSARAASGATDSAGIAAEMRRQNPDAFTDGVVGTD